MPLPTSREKDALRFIQKLGGKASAVAVSKHLSIGVDYADLLCSSLAKGGYVVGSRRRGYEITSAGDSLLAGGPLAGAPVITYELDRIPDEAQALAQKVKTLAREVTLENFDQYLTALFILRGQLLEEEAKTQVEFTCTVGREYAANLWGEMWVSVIDRSREDRIAESKLVKYLTKWADPQVARRGIWIRYTGRLPTGTEIRIFADGGDKEGRYRQYQERQDWHFILEREAEELIFTGEYAGRFEARMRPLTPCRAMVRKKPKERVDRPKRLEHGPVSGPGLFWE